MNTTVAFGSGYHGSSERTTLFVVQPAIQEAREPEPAVIRLPSSAARLEGAYARVPVPKPKVWEWLELGFVAVLALSVLVSVLLFLEQRVPDIILLDIKMPGMDGIATCRLIKQRPEWKNVPIIFITGADELAQKLAAFGAGAVDFVTNV
jgi:CheY-like chemotaxis protein